VLQGNFQTPHRRESPPTIFNNEHLKIGLIFSVLTVNSGARGSNLKKLFHVTCRESGMRIRLQLLGAYTFKTWEGQKIKIDAISDNFRFRSRISPEWIKISTSGKRRYQLRSLLRLMKKIESTNHKVHFSHVDSPKITSAVTFNHVACDIFF